MSKPTLRDVLFFIRFNHSDIQNVSFARAIMTAYLADWRSALVRGEQITEMEWTLERIFVTTEIRYILTGVGEDAPVDWDAMLATKEMPSGTAIFDADATTALRYVIEIAERKQFDEFLRLVSSTYPVLTQASTTAPLDLVVLADRYKHLGPSPA